ncbi:MAG: hypothetical protein OHK0050_26970 [Roseiflexaceae bacterium]
MVSHRLTTPSVVYACFASQLSGTSMHASYLDITITIGSGQDGSHPLRVVGPGGDTTATLQLPSRDAAFQQLLTRLKRLDTDRESLATIGRGLFDALMQPGVSELYARSQGLLQEGQSLRLVFDIQADQGAQADVSALPWEFLSDAAGPLALRGIPVVRYLPQNATIPRLRTPLPLKVLLTAAPTPPVPQIEQELALIQSEIARLGGLVEVTVESKLTKARLQDLLRGGFHIWHFLGHGGFSRTGEGRLLLVDDQGETDPLTAAGLSVLLAGSGVRLVVLNACQGGQLGADPLRSLAPALIQSGVPALIAMQFAVPEETARIFAAEFYQSIAEGFPIESCLTEGRRAVASIAGPQRPDWGIPVLYTRAADGQLFDLPPLPKPPCPYPGMVPFRASDTRFFYGREVEIDDMLRRIRIQKRLLVIGPSGSGKSSLVRAGFLPRLANSTLFPPNHWRVAEFRPGSNPLERLAEATKAPADAPAEQHLLLFVDQFEELFTTTPAEQRGPFVAALDHALEQHHATLLIAMRADFYPDLMNSPLWPIDPSERIEVAPLRGDALRIAIEQPAKDVGVRLENGLVDRLLSDAADEPGVLPLIQETMVLLWDRMPLRMLTIQAYADLGQGDRSGLAVAIATRADATMAALDPARQTIARRILLRLVQFGEGRSDTRRQQSLNELELPGEDVALFQSTLRALTDSRLLTITSDAGREQSLPRCDISHEALIRGWPTLREWVAARRNAELTRRRLEEKARYWIELGSGQGGLLDAVELAEAERWLERAEATDLGYSRNLIEFINFSKSELELAESEREAARQRELTQARELAEEQQRRAESEQQRAEQQASFVQKLRRNATILRIALGGTLLLLVLTIVFWVQSRNLSIEAEEQRQAAVVARDQAELSADIQVGLTILANAQAELASGNTDIALALTNFASNMEARIRPTNAEVLLSDAAYTPGTAKVLKGHVNSVWSVAVSPDGSYAFSAGEDTMVHIWDLASGSEVGRLEGHTETIFAVAINKQGTMLASAGSDKVIRLWDIATRTEIAQLRGHTGTINTLGFTPDGTLLISGSADKTLRIWNLDAFATVQILNGHSDNVWGLAVSPDGATVLSASEDKSVRQWSIATGEQLYSYSHSVAMYTVAFQPNGKQFATAGNDRAIWVWEIGGNEPVRTLNGHTDLLLGVGFSSDGRSIYSVSADASARIWDVISGREVRRFLGHEGQVTGAALLADGARLVTCSGDNTLRVWELIPGAQEQLLELGGTVSSVNLLPDATHALATLDSGVVHVLDLQQNLIVGSLIGHTDLVYQSAISADGQVVVTSSRDRTIRIWDLAARREIRALRGHTDRVTTVALSPNRWMVASGSFDRSIRIWDLISATEVYSLTGHTRAVQSVAFSPDGTLLVSGSRDKTIRIWDLNQRREIRSITGHNGEVSMVRFSADGSQIISASTDGTARIWDTATGAELHRFRGHTRPVLAVALSPDGSLVATSSSDTTVRIWEVESEREIRRLRGHTESVLSVTFLPTGRGVISAGSDGTVRVWRIDSLSELIAWTNQHRYIPDLSCEQRVALGFGGICPPTP